MTLFVLTAPVEKKTISSFSADAAGGAEQAVQRMRGSISMEEKTTERHRCPAFEAAMRKLSARMRTEQEIRQFLRKAEYSVDETEAAIAELKSYGYLHDERYCREYFLYAKARGKADARIVRELAQKGIFAETARNVIEDLRAEEAEDEGRTVDDHAAALAVGRKMLRNQWDDGKTVDDRFLARVGRRLAGLGYDSSVIYDIFGKLRQDERDRREAER